MTPQRRDASLPEGGGAGDLSLYPLATGGYRSWTW